MSTKNTLIDTSIWIPAFRRNGPPVVKSRVDTLIADNQAAINGVIKAELLQGAKNDQEFHRIQINLDSLHFLNSIDWNRVGEIAYQLRKRGTSIPLPDVMIAVQAELSECILLHADSHFDVIAKIAGLAAESMVPEIKKWRNTRH